MIRLSGSTVAALESHCLRYLDHRDAGVPRDDELFQPGIVAHAVLEAGHRLAIRNQDGQLSDSAIDNVADAVVARLTTEGRSYRGKAEPPVGPLAAIEGRDLAIRWARRNPFPLDLAPEVKLNADAQWRPCDGDKLTAYTGILDLYGPHQHESEDGDVFPGVAVVDYKTAWHTDAGELDSPQFRLYTLLAVAHNPGASYVRRVVHNLRTLQTFEDTLWIDDDGEAALRRWRRDVEVIAAAAEHRGSDGQRPARPGATCIGCPYVARCDAATSLLGAEVTTPAEIAAAYAVAEARRSTLAALARKVAGEGRLDVPGGSVGYHEATERVVLPDVAQRILRRFYEGREDVTAPAFLDRHAMEVALLGTLGISAGNASTFAQRVTTPPGRARRTRDEKQAGDDLAASLVSSKTVARFGVIRSTPLDGNTDRPLTPAEAGVLGAE